VTESTVTLPPQGDWSTTMATTTEEMRQFALDCLRWSDETPNPSHRDLMLRIAKTWMNTASSIERHIGDGGELALPDLRIKLN
jgi:hypothetical protein